MLAKMKENPSTTNVHHIGLYKNVNDEQPDRRDADETDVSDLLVHDERERKRTTS